MKINKNKYLVLIIIFFILAFLPLNNIVSAVTYTTVLDWNAWGAGSTYGTNVFLTWTGVANFQVSTNYYHSSPTSCQWYQYTGALLYLNFTNNLTMNGLNIAMYDNAGTATNSDCTIYIYNQTGVDILRFFLSCDTLDRRINVYDYATSSYQTLCSTSADIFQKYIHFGFQNNYTVGTSPINYVYYYMTNSAGIVTYKTEKSWNSTEEYGVDEQKVSQIKFVGSTTTSTLSVYFDDVNITSDDFTGEGSGCKTYGTEYYATGTGFSEYDEFGFTKQVAEFVNQYRINGTIKGFELYVPYDFTTTIHNWHLYINGIYQTDADCCYAHNMGYKMQFNNINKTIDNEYVIIDIYRTDDNVQLFGYNYIWYPYVDWAFIYTGDAGDIINDKLDGEIKTTGIASYVIYYTVNDTPITTCNYPNDVWLQSITDNQNILTFTTVFFGATVNSTNTPYKIQINKDGTNLSAQGYPMDIIRCSDIYSFTPTEIGTYYICLSDNAVNISGTFHYFNVTTETLKTYNIFTYPNPSNYGQTITVSTYINDTGNFAVCFFHETMFATNYNSSTYTNFVEDGFYNFTMNTGGIAETPFVYLRIFKEVGSFYSAIGDLYIHYFKNTNLESYIAVNKTEVTVGEIVTIYGYNMELLIRVAIFSNAELLVDNVNMNYFSYEKIFDEEGIFQIALKKYINDGWINIDYITVSVSVPASSTVLSGYTNIILSIIIILFLVCIPLFIMKKLDTNTPIMAGITAGMLFLGVGISSYLKLLPEWMAPAMVFFVILIIVVIWFSKRGS